jgi:hypothetical protein
LKQAIRAVCTPHPQIIAASLQQIAASRQSSTASRQAIANFG